MTSVSSAIPAFFSSGSASELYVFNRDSPYREDVRDYCEALWNRYEPYNGDPHFLSDARQNLCARTWEMILTCALLDLGLPLVRPPCNGPDIQIAPDSERPTIWIEAVTVELGSGGDHAGLVEYQKIGDHGALFYTKPDKTALRYTSALASKTKQLTEFIDRKIVAPCDIFVIAINGALLDDFTTNDPLPEILKSVYPFGEEYVSYAVNQAASSPVEHGVTYRGFVSKSSGTQIPTDAFLTREYAGVSALIYSRTTAWNPQPRCLDYMLTIHNRMAMVPLPRGAFAFGREAVLECDGIRWLKHAPIAVGTTTPSA
jgi:hypothetical protein